MVQRGDLLLEKELAAIQVAISMEVISSVGKYIAATAGCQISSCYTQSAFLHNSIKDGLISISGSKYHSEAQPNSTSEWSSQINT